MIVEIGHFALVLALFVALVQSVVPMVGAARGHGAWMAVGSPAAVLQVTLMAVSYAALTHAYLVSDFSVLNVATNSHSAKPLLYKITGVWANHEGSMLLWVAILALFGAAVAVFGRNLPPALRARVLSVQGMIGLAFIAFILFTSNPFERLGPAPLDGRGMNPLLQDPGLAFHPPMLYLGYVGLSVAFSFAVAALIEGRVDAAWARWVRPWTLAAWTFLTLGIALGSWWAYYELGWGGWWYWDPVENASFMPWLLAVALLHSAIVVEKRDALKTWTVLMAILAFSLSLIGTFLVRSGVLTSVHAFAQDPERGVFILAMLVVAIGGALTLYAIRAPSLKAGGLFAPVSREGALIFNNLMLSVACATVFLGTLYPLFLDALGGGQVSVGPPFFNATFVPLMVPVLVALAIGPFLGWKRGDLAGALARLRAAAACVVGVVILSGLMVGFRAPLALVGLALAAWVTAGAVIELAGRIRLFRVAPGDSLRRAVGLPRAAWGMTLAHAGIGILVAGVTASSAFTEEVVRAMAPGDVADVAGYAFRFDGAEAGHGPNYRLVRGRFTVTRDGAPVTVLTPEKRFFTVQRQETTEASIHTTGFADLYAVIGDRQPDGDRWTVRLYHNPLVPWIWVGCVMMGLGGIVSLTDRRHRVGAPVRHRRPAPAVVPAA